MHTRSFAAIALLVASLGCGDDAQSPTAPAATSPRPAGSAATAWSFWQVSAGEFHTCAITTDQRAYCWGLNTYGELGDGTNTSRPRPVAVATSLRFRQISAGVVHTCAVTTDYRAYCWGQNALDNFGGGGGQLGDGTTTSRRRPVPVSGGRRFQRVEAGGFHTCGVSYPERGAYCWGENGFGELGDGTQTNRLTPVAVVGGREFRQVNGGREHTCGITTANRAYCWGGNRFGQLGDSATHIYASVPSPVAGSRRWQQIDAGLDHTCAVTTGSRAFCWGYGGEGQLGNGKTYSSFWPRAVAGRLYFTRVSAGSTHSCGESTSKRAYCWGDNGSGSLGDGTTTDRPSPVRVVGGLTFDQLSAGGGQTCGKTPTAAAYCWGNNFYSQLGDGTKTNRLRPKPVAAPM